jgi:hypothetical protein
VQCGIEPRHSGQNRDINPIFIQKIHISASAKPILSKTTVIFLSARIFQLGPLDPLGKYGRACEKIQLVHCLYQLTSSFAANSVAIVSGGDPALAACGSQEPRRT